TARLWSTTSRASSIAIASSKTSIVVTAAPLWRLAYGIAHAAIRQDRHTATPPHACPSAPRCAVLSWETGAASGHKLFPHRVEVGVSQHQHGHAPPGSSGANRSSTSSAISSGVRRLRDGCVGGEFGKHALSAVHQA